MASAASAWLSTPVSASRSRAESGGWISASSMRLRSRVKRPAQIVGEAVGGQPHARHQPLDLLDHGVQAVGQPVELVTAAGVVDAP